MARPLRTYNRRARRKHQPAGRIVFVRWVTVHLDDRTRHLIPFGPSAAWDNVEPPRNLGRFDCAGRYRIQEEN